MVIPSLITHIIHRSDATNQEYEIPNNGDNGGEYVCRVTKSTITADSTALTITAIGNYYFILLNDCKNVVNNVLRRGIITNLLITTVLVSSISKHDRLYKKYWSHYRQLIGLFVKSRICLNRVLNIFIYPPWQLN